MLRAETRLVVHTTSHSASCAAINLKHGPLSALNSPVIYRLAPAMVSVKSQLQPTGPTSKDIAVQYAMSHVILLGRND